METLGLPPVDMRLLPDIAAWLAINPSKTLDEGAHSAFQPDHFFAIASLLGPSDSSQSRRRILGGGVQAYTIQSMHC
jgi:hypothetical protein